LRRIIYSADRALGKLKRVQTERTSDPRRRSPKLRSSRSPASAPDSNGVPRWRATQATVGRGVVRSDRVWEPSRDVATF